MDRLRSVFNKKPRLIAVAVFIVALSLPIVISQVLREQDIRQGAQSANPVSLSFSPFSKNVKVNDVIEVTLKINTNGNDISAVEGYLKYVPADLSLIEITGGQNYTVVNPNTDPNVFKPIVIYNQTANPAIGSDVTLAVIKFKALKEGQTEVLFGPIGSSPLKIAASGSSTNVTTSQTASGNYTVAGNISPTTTDTTNTSPSPTTKTEDTNSPPPPDSPTQTPTATQVPTATLIPTATSIPGDTGININIQLPGIGKGSASLGLNATPIHPQRNATVQLLDNTNSVVKTVTSLMVFTPDASAYFGQFSLGPDFQSGSYTAKIRLDNTLNKNLSGVVSITKGVLNASTVWTANPVSLISGDLNNDNTLGVIDWTYMIACVKNESSCTAEIRKLADLNDNGSVDELDVQILQRGFALRNGD